jgi:hypothetical protein
VEWRCVRCSLLDRRNFLLTSCYILVVDTTGLDSFAGAGRDIDIVFEIEKEIGDFYRGWDDEGALEEEEESSSDADDDKRPSATSTTLEPAAASATTGDTSLVPFPRLSPEAMPRSATIPVSMGASPSGTDVMKKRRGSLPNTDRAIDISALASGLSPRKRRGSIMEPSPLARLFVRSPPPEPHLPRVLGHRSAMSASLGQTGTQFLANPPIIAGDHYRHKSLSGMPNAPAPLQTIPSGKRVSFSPVNSRTVPDKDQIATASALEEDLITREARPDIHAMQDKLNSIEQQQKQITKMLQRLLATSSSAAAEGRRNSNLSIDDD